jgi:hypothetical protein
VLTLLPDEWLRKMGYKISYECEWGSYKYRYDYLDFAQSRPVHKDMSVAPPWAKRVVRRG